jgi:hypothetical protein
MYSLSYGSIDLQTLADCGRCAFPGCIVAEMQQDFEFVQRVNVSDYELFNSFGDT